VVDITEVLIWTLLDDRKWAKYDLWLCSLALRYGLLTTVESTATRSGWTGTR